MKQFELVWLDGDVFPASEFSIAVNDQGLLYGVGLFETTRTWRLRPWLWDFHLSRLQQSANLLGFEVEARLLPSEKEVAQFVRVVDADDLVVRLNVSGGAPGGRPRVWMTTRPLPAATETWRLRISPTRICRSDRLAAVKSFNYAARILAHRDAVFRGGDDCLLISADDLVLEAGTANLFLRFGDKWVTPALSGGVLPGTVRRLLLESPSADILERDVHLDELPEVKEAVVTNSVRGVVSVSAVDNVSLSRTAMTDALVELVQSAVPK